jgi:DNA adenine methylase
MLYRIGNKQRLAKKIIPHFPEHEIYIEPFFGAGGIFFNKQKSKINLLNDLNEDVANLYIVLQNHNELFTNALINIPIDQSIFNNWRKFPEKEPIQKALRFVMLSNFSYLGQGNSFALLLRDVKSLTLNKIPNVNELLENVIIANLDFEKFLKSITFDNEIKKSKSFIYADPPYLNTSNNYNLKWTVEDTVRLFLVLDNLNIRFAVSEIESDFINEIADYFKLNIIEIATFRSQRKTRKELLITNY